MDPFKNSSVIELFGSDFKNEFPWKLKDSRCTFVLFYADWCGYCQDFKPEYAKFANKSQFIRVCAVNADSNKKLLESINSSELNPEFKVEGFPTLILYSKGEPVEVYSEEKNFVALNSKAMKFCDENCKCSEFSENE